LKDLISKGFVSCADTSSSDSFVRFYALNIEIIVTSAAEELGYIEPMTLMFRLMIPGVLFVVVMLEDADVRILDLGMTAVVTEAGVEPV
jgi:hypothetical protein